MIRNIIRVLTLVPLSLYLIYCIFTVFKYELRPKYLDCGRVVSLSSNDVAIKHGSNTMLYLNIEFEKSGFRSIETSPTTYFSKKSGDYVCFSLDEQISTTMQINQFIGILMLLLISIIALIFFIRYLIGNH